MKKIIVIGAGAAGMMAAVTAAEAGADVTVLERNPFAGKKLRITGKGRCNVTNASSPAEMLENIPRNPKFLYGAVNRFSPADVMTFFEEAGVPLKTERGRRVFPVSDKAADIQEALVRRMKQAGVRIVYQTRVTSVEQKDDGGYAVSCENRRVFEAEAVIFATGGISYPLTGSTGDGHRILGELGVACTSLKPSLVPVVTEEDFAPLSGLSLKNVQLNVFREAHCVFSERGELLFTHFGVSGPLVLSASSNMQEAPVPSYRMTLNLKPALKAEELDRRLVGDLGKYAARDFVNSLGDLLPVKLIPYVIERSGIDPRRKSGSVTREERARLAEALTAFPITPREFRPVEEAIITSGGVAVSELSPKTMELRAHPGLYVCGELIDVDAYTGGYNLQIAFSTARAAGKAAAESE